MFAYMFGSGKQAVISYTFDRSAKKKENYPNVIIIPYHNLAFLEIKNIDYTTHVGFTITVQRDSDGIIVVMFHLLLKLPHTN